MSEHEFSFVVSGVDPGADDFEDRFAAAGCDDATLMLVNGLVAVAFVLGERMQGADAVVYAVLAVALALLAVEGFRGARRPRRGKATEPDVGPRD